MQRQGRRPLIPRTATKPLGVVKKLEDGNQYEMRQYVGKRRAETHAYCQATKVIDRVRWVCQYENRLDNLRAEIRRRKAKGETLSHVHVWEIPTGQLNITEFLSKSVADNPISKCTIADAYSLLLNELAYITAKLDLSLPKALSEEMRDFVVTLMSLGAQLHEGKLNPSKVKIPNKHDLRKRIVEIGEQLDFIRLNEFSEYEYCAVAIDEGSTLGTKYVNFIIHNCERNLGEYVFYTEKVKGVTARDYQAPLIHATDLLGIYDIRPSCIVSDGGPGQMKALMSNWTEPGDMVKSKLLKEVIIVPCLCHKLNNAYQHIIREQATFAADIETVHRLADILARHDAEIASAGLKKCPKHVSTRWLYDYEICEYMRANKLELNKICAKHGAGRIPETIDSLIDAGETFLKTC